MKTHHPSPQRRLSAPRSRPSFGPWPQSGPTVTVGCPGRGGQTRTRKSRSPLKVRRPSRVRRPAVRRGACGQGQVIFDSDHELHAIALTQGPVDVADVFLVATVDAANIFLVAPDSAADVFLVAPDDVADVFLVGPVDEANAFLLALVRCLPCSVVESHHNSRSHTRNASL
jgi:hypothetical protein